MIVDENAFLAGRGPVDGGGMYLVKARSVRWRMVSLFILQRRS